MRPLYLPLLLLVASCTQHASPQQENACVYTHQRPIVALVPVVDNTHSNLPWSLSEELTSAIHYRLMQKDTFYLIDQEKIRKCKTIDNPFGSDLTWIKKAFFQNEFVVFLELISHEETAAKDSPTELSMKMRIRVIDVRQEEPVVILQEIIHDSHYLPKQFTGDHFHQIEWGKENYNISPLGIAHTQLSREVASRIEDYVLLATK